MYVVSDPRPPKSLLPRLPPLRLLPPPRRAQSSAQLPPLRPPSLHPPPRTTPVPTRASDAPIPMAFAHAESGLARRVRDWFPSWGQWIVAGVCVGAAAVVGF